MKNLQKANHFKAVALSPMEVGIERNSHQPGDNTGQCTIDILSEIIKVHIMRACCSIGGQTYNLVVVQKRIIKLESHALKYFHSQSYIYVGPLLFMFNNLLSNKRGWLLAIRMYKYLPCYSSDIYHCMSLQLALYLLLIASLNTIKVLPSLEQHLDSVFGRQWVLQFTGYLLVCLSVCPSLSPPFSVYVCLCLSLCVSQFFSVFLSRVSLSRSFSLSLTHTFGPLTLHHFTSFAQSL